MKDIDRIIAGLEVIRAIDPPIEVDLGNGYMESGWDMSPDSLLPEQLAALTDSGWKYKLKRSKLGVGCWRLDLE